MNPEVLFVIGDIDGDSTTFTSLKPVTVQQVRGIVPDARDWVTVIHVHGGGLMAQKVAKVGVKKETGYLYFVSRAAKQRRSVAQASRKRVATCTSSTRTATSAEQRWHAAGRRPNEDEASSGTSSFDGDHRVLHRVHAEHPERQHLLAARSAGDHHVLRRSVSDHR